MSNISPSASRSSAGCARTYPGRPAQDREGLALPHRWPGLPALTWRWVVCGGRASEVQLVLELLLVLHLPAQPNLLPEAGRPAPAAQHRPRSGGALRGAAGSLPEGTRQRVCRASTTNPSKALKTQHCAVRAPWPPSAQGAGTRWLLRDSGPKETTTAVNNNLGKASAW